MMAELVDANGTESFLEVGVGSVTDEGTFSLIS